MRAHYERRILGRCVGQRSQRRRHAEREAEGLQVSHAFHSHPGTLLPLELRLLEPAFLNRQIFDRRGRAKARPFCVNLEARGICNDFAKEFCNFLKQTELGDSFLESDDQKFSDDYGEEFTTWYSWLQELIQSLKVQLEPAPLKNLLSLHRRFMKKLYEGCNYNIKGNEKKNSESLYARFCGAIIFCLSSGS